MEMEVDLNVPVPEFPFYGGKMVINMIDIKLKLYRADWMLEALPELSAITGLLQG